MQNSSDVLNQLRTFQSGRRKPQDVLGEAENRLGLPTARQRLAGLRTAIGNTENLLRNVEPSVAGRTAGSLVTDAQRTKLVSNERAPIAEQFREESRALEGETGNIADLSQRSLSEAQLGLSADDTQETGLRSLYGSLYQREQDEVQRQERERAFQEELRKNQAAQSAQNAYLRYMQGAGTPLTQASPAAGGARAIQRGDKGYNFLDASGSPVSAATYAQLKGQSFRDVLQQLANSGDSGANTALGFVGNDFGYDPNKVTNQALADLYNNLVWGSGRSASVFNPSPTGNAPVQRFQQSLPGYKGPRA